MLFNRLDRVAAARAEVCRIELELDELRIRVFEDEIEICRALAESVEVIVVGEWNAQVGSSLAQLCLEGAKTCALVRRYGVNWSRWMARRKKLLSRGQQKSIQTDRVILVLGPAEELK